MPDIDLIYCTARELPPEERPAYLDQVCKSDSALRARVEQMLAVAEQAEAFVADPMAIDHLVRFDSASERPAGGTERQGARIGPYTLLQQIGEGGFGIVWMAEQTEPIVRKVAIKVVKAGMDTHEVLARFEAERQALAMMDHPNIARVLEAGATASGRPYFAMELVKGIPITSFCDDQQYGVRKRLELFRDVCSAVNHAHQKGIIHRDIKPSNVMVTLHGDKPVVKVIDFGIAKATQGKLTDKTLFTRFEQFLGTPAYMSPEQAAMSGLDIDTRSDIYSLGVLLYTLLAGDPPFDTHTLLSAGYDEMRRIIREDEPLKPSTRLTRMRSGSSALKSKIAPSAIAGELDWIVMKAIDKDRTRRYETANGLAADIGRYLADEPVQAAAPSSAYLFRKFVRRHRAVFLVVSTILLLLIVATIVSVGQAMRATRAEQQARQHAEAARTEAARANEQQRLAEENLVETKMAMTEATAQRNRADREAEAAQQNLYCAEMHLGQQAWRGHRGMKNMLDLLGRWVPTNGAPDRRGWEWFYLKSLPSHNQRTLSAGGRSGAGHTVAWSVASKRLATGTASGLIQIWDTDREQVTSTLRGPRCGGEYWGNRWLEWSPDGTKLAAGCANGTVRLWQGDGGEFQDMGKQESSVCTVAFNADGSRLAAWATNGAIRIWDLHTGQLAANLFHPGLTTAGAWSLDGKSLATGHEDGTVTFSGTDSNSPIVTLQAHGDAIYHVAWSPDGSRIATTSASDFFVQIWDVASRQKVLGRLWHSHGITSILWESDGARLATCSMDETIKVWNTTTGEEHHTFRGHGVTIASLAWGPDGRLASMGQDGSLLVWNPLRDQESIVLPGKGIRATAVTWSPDSRRVASGGDDGEIRIWDPATQKVVLSLKAHDERRMNLQFGLIQALAWSPDGTRLASAGTDGAAKIWDTKSGREVFALPTDCGAIWSIAWSRDGSRLATGSQDGRIRIVEAWDRAPEIRAFQAHTGRHPDTDARRGVRSVAWSLQGDRLASGGWDSLAKVWDPILCAELSRLKGHRGAVLDVSWDPDGRRIATAGGDRLIRIWDAATGAGISTLRGHNDFVDAAAWNPDGKRLVSASFDSSVRVWDPVTGKETFVLPGNPGMFHSVSWSPDGTRLAAACGDGQIWIWDATHGTNGLSR